MKSTTLVSRWMRCWMLVVTLVATEPSCNGASPGPELLGDPAFELSAPNGTFPSSGAWQRAWLGEAGAVCTSTAGRTGNGLWAYTGSPALSWWSGTYQEMATRSGYAYLARAWVRTPLGASAWVPGSHGLVRLILYSGGTIHGTNDSPLIREPTPGWTELTVQTPPLPSTVDRVRLVLLLQKPAIVGQSLLNFDDCSLREVVPPPTIRRHPHDTNVPTGGTATFSVEADGIGLLSYQWRRGEEPIDGETTDTLVLSDVTAEDEGPYSVLVGNEGGFVASREALLSVRIANPPRLLRVEPAPNSIASSAHGVVGIFDQALDSASATFDALAVHPLHTGRWRPSSASISVEGPNLVATGTQPWHAGEVVQATLTQPIRGVDGPAEGIPFVWRFRAPALAGTAIFSDTGQVLGGENERNVILGDVDGDGDLDALAIAGTPGSGTNPNKIWLNDGTGLFVNAEQRMNAASTASSAFGDLDGDGDLDVFLANFASVEVWLNDGQGVFTKIPVNPPSVFTASAVRLGDVDGDGDLDAVVVASGNGLNDSGSGVVYFNDGFAGFGTPQPQFGIRHSSGFELGDIDTDGDLDAVFSRANLSDTRAAVWVNDGSGIFADSGQALGTTESTRTALADLDNDGDLDAVLQLDNDGCEIWLNDGQGVFSRGASVTSLDPTSGFALADFDADGALDLMMTTFRILPEQSFVEVWRNVGTAQFVLRSKALLGVDGVSWTHATRGDLDGDGTIDLFVWSSPFSSVQASRIWLNRAQAPTIEITSLPPFGSNANLRGRVIDPPSGGFSIYTLTFIDGLGWYTKPTCASPLTALQPDGTFEVDVVTGGIDPEATAFALFLVPSAFQRACVTSAGCPPPDLVEAAVATLRVSRPGRIVSFSGYDWLVKSGSAPVGPEGNRFSPSTDNVWVDACGRLHLRITQRNGLWYCAEVINRTSLGRGTYVFELGSQLGFDPNAVLGLFTWDVDTCDNYHREIDIEFSRWGNSSDPNFGQFVVQPWSVPGHRERFPVPSGSIPTTHEFSWETDRIGFASYRGLFQPNPSPNRMIHEYQFSDQTFIPQPATEKPRINLWLQQARPPSDGQEIEVVINRFVFAPPGVARTEPGLQPPQPTPGCENTGVIARHVFYNGSAWDGNDPAAGGLDDAAIASDKVALRPGQTASFANYTSYSRGLNAVMVDMLGVLGTPGIDDFEFRVGNDAIPDSWPSAPNPATVVFHPGAGMGGSDRVTLVWEDNVIQKQWLQLTVLPTPNTGLSTPDVFYFGNAIGDSGDSPANAQVNVLDEAAVRGHPRNFLNPAPIDSPHDFNRDRNVNVLDEAIARANATSFLTALKLLTVPELEVAVSTLSSLSDGHPANSLPSAGIRHKPRFRHGQPAAAPQWGPGLPGGFSPTAADQTSSRGDTTISTGATEESLLRIEVRFHGPDRLVIETPDVVGYEFALETTRQLRRKSPTWIESNLSPQRNEAGVVRWTIPLHATEPHRLYRVRAAGTHR